MEPKLCNKANCVLIKPRSPVKDKKNKTKMTIKTEQQILPMNSNFYKVIYKVIFTRNI